MYNKSNSIEVYWMHCTWIQVGVLKLFVFSASRISARNFNASKLAVPKIDLSVPEGAIVIGLLFDTTFVVWDGVLFFFSRRFCSITLRIILSYLLFGFSSFKDGNLRILFVAKRRSCCDTTIGLVWYLKKKQIKVTLRILNNFNCENDKERILKITCSNCSSLADLSLRRVWFPYSINYCDILPWIRLL